MMKEEVLDVLLYLFETYMADDREADDDLDDADRDSLQAQLTEAGFSPRKIQQAFDWIDALEDLRPLNRLEDRRQHAIRVYAPEEQQRLDTECRGFLLYLEELEVLDEAQRELVIDRVMALDAAEIDLDDLKWIVLMVLFNQPEQADAFAWMENLMFDCAGETVH
jgi:Smg protein